MPSTVVHLGLAAMLAAALLGEALDRRHAVVVLAAVIVPDLDTFAGLALPGAHRALLHTLLLPTALGCLLAWDTQLRGRSTLRSRVGDAGVRTAWVAVVVFAGAGIGPDLVTSGVNAWYPLHDQFYTVDGHLLLSSDRGLVQTFIEPQSGDPSTTANTHYRTGVDPTPGPERGRVERLFPVVASGTQLLGVVTGFGALAARLWERR